MHNYSELIDNICEQGYHLIDNFLPIEQVEQLRTLALQLASDKQFSAAKIGHQNVAQQNPRIRNDLIHWLDEGSSDAAVNNYFTQMQTIAATLNQHLYLGLVEFETHFALYQPGSFYKKHVDQFNNKKERQISCVYYLSSNWETVFGGQLQLYDQNDNILTSVFPQPNRLICFKSDIAHEVCETKQLRLSIAGWMKTRARIE